MNNPGLVCEYCNFTMHIVIADSIEHCADEHFRLFMNNKVAIWPMANGVVEEIWQTIPSIREENVWFIDSAKVKQGAHFHDKIVRGPEVIEENGIDTVFITITNLWSADIIKTIQGFPSVKRIFYVGDLLDPHFPERVKDMH